MKTLFLALSIAFVPFFANASIVDKQGGKGPIEITSDTLEVLDNENIAIFTGNVIAIQAETQLKSDKMKVFYRDGAEQGENEAVSKIEVDGNVFMTTPTETARGISGVYDVDKDEITLNGEVVLTKDKNVLKGEHLVHNMTTGKSLLRNSSGEAVAEEQKPARVRALFVPSEKKVAQ